MKYPSLRVILGRSVVRDLSVATLIAVLAGLLAARVELHEFLFESTRRWERFEIDELPAALFAFACCMVALYARRHAQLRRALRENRRLTGRLLDVQEQERGRLARELHDELGQTLNAIKLDAMALPAAAGEPGALARIAERIAGNADAVYGAAGNLVRDLRPPALDELGLVAALEACVDRWRASNPELIVQLSTGGELEELGETLNLAVYRIVQEALTNTVRHARASHAWIDLTRAPEEGGGLLLEIRDDGTGFGAGVPRPGGHGLAGMRERVRLLGGRFQLLSEVGRGVTIRAEIPA